LDERIDRTKVLKINISWSQSVPSGMRPACIELGLPPPPYFGLNCTNRQ